MGIKKISARGSQWFRRKQKELGLSNNKMAEMLCCTTSHVEHMRSGRRRIIEVTRKLIESQIELKKKS